MSILQRSHRYSFPPPVTMKPGLLKPLFPQENASHNNPSGDHITEICLHYIPRSFHVPEGKLEPFQSPLTESNLKFHTTIVSIASYYLCVPRWYIVGVKHCPLLRLAPIDRKSAIGRRIYALDLIHSATDDYNATL
jgi:hypothetical protein